MVSSQPVRPPSITCDYYFQRVNLLNNLSHLGLNDHNATGILELTMSALKQFVHNRPKDADDSLLKTVTFAVTHFTVAFTVAYLLTGDILIGSLIAMVEPAINTVAYFFHEKIWARRQKRRQAAADVMERSSHIKNASGFRPVS
jgi:uncharacterized membrane protein